MTNQQIGTLSKRLIWLRTLAVSLFIMLAVGFWHFQVVRHTQFQEMAVNNHQRARSLLAPRGLVFDRHEHLLVDNRKSFTVSIIREHSTDLEYTTSFLSQVTRVDKQKIKAALDARKDEPLFRPIAVIEDATLQQVASVMARRLDAELPDVVVEEIPMRSYPQDSLGAHIFGYVGEASNAQVKEGIARSGAVIGQSGVEKTYNDLLMGKNGTRHVVVNSVGRKISTIRETPPIEGQRVQLTIDYDLQEAAEASFKQAGLRGSAVLLDPRNGEILALASLPAYDPNTFAGGIDRLTWNDLNSDSFYPLRNRAIQGRYAPGSTFKIVVATAALEEGLVTPDHKVNCKGGATYYGRYVQCYRGRGHGLVDMRQALEKSCNVYFYTLGDMLGIDQINKWASQFGLAGLTGIDLPNEVASIVPSTEWKYEQTGEKWYPGETISVSIGQGQVSVTPISLAVMIATLANGEEQVVPRLVKAVGTGDGKWEPMSSPPVVRNNVLFSPETLETLREGLWLAVNDSGTAIRAKVSGRDVAGKTGTAQVISNEGRLAALGKTDLDLRDHGWFVFFAPKDNPEIAGVIFAEHAEQGSVGAPIAKHLVETYFAKKEGIPLPQLEPSTASEFSGVM